MTLIGIISIFLFLFGLSYFYYPSFVVKLNKFVRDKIFSDKFVLINRKKIGLILVMTSILVFYFGVLVPKMSVSFRQQNIRDYLYHAWRYYYQGYYNHAEKLCKEILFIDPENLAVKEQLALIYFAKGDYKKSLYYSKQVLEEKPDNRRMERIIKSIKNKGIKK